MSKTIQLTYHPHDVYQPNNPRKWHILADGHCYKFIKLCQAEDWADLHEYTLRIGKSNPPN